MEKQSEVKGEGDQIRERNRPRWKEKKVEVEEERGGGRR